MPKEMIQYSFSFSIGDKVVYKNRMGKDEGYVTGIFIRQGGCIVYDVTWSDKNVKSHNDFELELIS